MNLLAKEADFALVEQAKNAITAVYRADNVYHTVGAALRCKNGRVYTGVNCDGIHGACAEFVAMGAAITAGEREFDLIVAVTGRHNGDRILPPCGNCRQMLYEYCPDIGVLIHDGRELLRLPILTLLPYPYHE